uniref:NADH-ubiquinone oxidoreductase chain 6 n=1 Tax=Curculionoidea sp. 17 KM-2017 TaxID=2219400 RepID=A0A346RGQ0_9CUCU|nr:NADH dehydrogenase subunit 6 [Curculionoidea sp. 17 KM-2017]
MFIYLSFFNWMLSLIFMFMFHPLSLGGMLLLQTIIISLMSGNFYMNFWFSYILFLIMIGGMLVMFIYMTSIASNEKFKLPKNMIFIIMMISFLMMFLMIMFMDKNYTMNLYANFIFKNQNMFLNNLSLSKFFNFPNMNLMLFLMTYLLITLIAIVKIVGKLSGSLRQK